MGTTKERDVGANEGSRSNRDGTCIEECTIEVDEDIAPHLDVRPIVDVDGAFYPWVFVKNRILFFVCCAWGGKRPLVICDALSGRLVWRRKACNGFPNQYVTHSLQNSAISRRVKSPALFIRPTARAHLLRAATSSGEKAKYNSPRLIRARFSFSSMPDNMVDRECVQRGIFYQRRKNPGGFPGPGRLLVTKTPVENWSLSGNQHLSLWI